MGDTVKEGVKEVLTGPATLLVYVLTGIGVALSLVANDTACQEYLSLIDKIELIVGGLIAGRAVAVSAKSVGK
jgi:hypothetical protein